MDQILLAISSVGRRFNRRVERAHARRVLSRVAECGQDVGIYGKINISGLQQIRIGHNVHIGDNAFIRAEGGLEIGDNTHISRNLVLYTVNHRFRDAARIPYDDEMVAKAVKIGRNVWIGMNVCITPGTAIGEGAIVGMGTVVSGEVPPFAIIGSERARVLGWRDVEHYARLDAASAYGGASGKALAKDAPG